MISVSPMPCETITAHRHPSASDYYYKRRYYPVVFRDCLPNKGKPAPTRCVWRGLLRSGLDSIDHESICKCNTAPVINVFSVHSSDADPIKHITTANKKTVLTNNMHSSPAKTMMCIPPYFNIVGTTITGSIVT